MILEDKVYGEEKIREDVLIDLINSYSLERLKGISQFGMPDEYYYKDGFSRYEHSSGVMVLLRKMHANLNEQIAGLLHDVSHTAFSHVIDWTIGDPIKEDYQDNIHGEIIENSEIPKILEKYGIDYHIISNMENFSLLEREAPLLCADRIDYSLRELELEKGVNFVNDFFMDLFVKNNQIVFRNDSIAEIFAREYARLQREHWAGDQARSRYYILSKILKKAMDKNIISINDLRKTDAYVLGLLNESGDREILENLNLLKRGFTTEDDENGIELKKKFRYVDPGISINSSVKRLSEVSENYRRFVDLEKHKSRLVRKIKIVPN